jgi:hypothetical protein
VLSDDDDTPCQTQLFFSQFQIEQFTNLRLLTLPDVKTHWLNSILQNLNKLERLHSLSFKPTQYSRQEYARSDNPISFTENGHLAMIPLSRLRQLKITNRSSDDLINIFVEASQLKSLNIHLTDAFLNVQSLSTLPRLTRLVLDIDDTQTNRFSPNYYNRSKKIVVHQHALF